MNFLKRHSTVMLLVLACGYFAQSASATGPYFAPALETEVKAIPWPPQTGLVTLRVILTPTYRTICTELNLEIGRLDNIEDPIIGLVGRDVDSTHSTVYELQCVVPSNDTSGIEMFVKCGEDSMDVHAFWVDDTSGTKFYQGNPRLFLSALYPNRKPKIVPADSVNHTPPPAKVDSLRNDEHD